MDCKPLAMKTSVVLQSSPLEAAAPESRHSVLKRLQANQYVLRVPRGGKSAVWKIFLHVLDAREQKLDFVLCRYCTGLFMYKGYASGTSSLMNHGIRCLDRPRIQVQDINSNSLVSEDWPDEFKQRPYFTISYLKRFKAGDRRSPSPISAPLDFSATSMRSSVKMESSAAYKVDQSFRPLEPARTYRPTYSYATSNASQGRSPDSARGSSSPEGLKIASGLFDAKADSSSTVFGHYYAALSMAANNYGVSVENLLKLADSATEPRLNGEVSSGMAAIEAAVAAAAATAEPAPRPNKPESYQLRHNNHLSVVFKQLAEDEAFMDVTLTAEGQSVKAHKSVLSAVSPYFSSVLRANPSQHPVIIMPWHVKFSELNSIVNYVYKGEMTVAAEELPSLLKTAEVLRITGLSPDNKSELRTHQTSSNRPVEITKPAASIASEIIPAVNPADFIDVDMTCVKEEAASVSDEDNDRPSAAPMTPIVLEKICIPSSSSRILQPPLLISSSKDDETDAEERCRNSLQTLAQLASLNTPPTNLSPSHEAPGTPNSPSGVFVNTSSPAASSPVSEPSPNVCPYCNEYLNSVEVDSHVSSKHAFKPAFLCKVCSRIYTRKMHYEQHAKSCHSQAS